MATETTTEQVPTEKQNPSLTVSLTLQEINVILGALQEMPFKIADPVLKSLVPQAQQALEDYKAQLAAESQVTTEE